MKKKCFVRSAIATTLCLLMLGTTTLLAGCKETTPTVSKIDLTGTLTSSQTSKTDTSSTVSANQPKPVSSASASKPTSSKKQQSIRSASATSEQTKIDIVKTYSVSFSSWEATPQTEHYVDPQSGLALPYALYLPKSKSKKHPVVLFLHGAGERGSDGNSQTQHFGKAFSAAGDLLQDAIVIAPQCPSSGWWNIDANSYGDESGYLGAAMHLLQDVIDQYGGDTDRVYVTGLSMGGYGTWQLLERYPDIFAAGVPVCGWGNSAAGSIFAEIPIWIYHGTADTTVSFSQSEQLYYAILNSGGTAVQFSVLDSVGHDAWNYAYVDREMFCWMFAQKRSKQIPREKTYQPLFHVTTPKNKVIFTELDILYLDYTFNNEGDPYINMELTDTAAQALYEAHKAYPSKAFTVFYNGKSLYQYKIANPTKTNLFTFAQTMNRSDFYAFYEIMDPLITRRQA